MRDLELGALLPVCGLIDIGGNVFFSGTKILMMQLFIA
jgi:hypothetical protein